jgi:hypothetical protein
MKEGILDWLEVGFRSWILVNALIKFRTPEMMQRYIEVE